MLTRVCPAVPAGAQVIATGVVALVLLAAPITSAQAGGIRTTNCVGAWWWWNSACTTQWGEATDPYVRTVPAARNQAEDSELAERDRKWVARCRPVLRPDQNGVERYHYAAPGCEYGKISE
jgi:hypothetical protein